MRRRLFNNPSVFVVRHGNLIGSLLTLNKAIKIASIFCGRKTLMLIF